MKNNNSRRKFIGNTLKAGVLVSAVGLDYTTASATENQTIVFKQTPLAFSYNALEPHIDAMTMEIHYSKHASAYTKNLNDAAAAELKGQTISIEEIFKNISSYSAKLRNNGGGHYNHELFWKCMQPNGSILTQGKLSDAIQSTFNSYENFKNKLSEAAMSRFGSGWAWLYLDDKKTLQIGSTPNQDNPLMDVSPVKGTPLLGLDIWEHAYYLKYQNRRAEYVSNWFNLINWKFVEENYLKAK
jgi:Fe-Mn family superoxide dismutase